MVVELKFLGVLVVMLLLLGLEMDLEFLVVVVDGQMLDNEPIRK